jgi:hypothetical protein
MAVVATQRHRDQLRLGDLDAQGFCPDQLGTDPQARAGRGRADQLNDHIVGDPMEGLMPAWPVDA